MLSFNVERLSLSNESCLKGLMALFIILSHSAWAQAFKIAGHSLASINFLPVGVFFFLSGYGLFQQYKAGKKFNFLKKAFVLLLPYWLLCCVWIPIFTDQEFSFKLIFATFLGDTFLPFAWYVKTQLICYFLWFLAPCLFREHKKNYILASIFIGLMIYAYYRRLDGVTSTTYITVFSFLGGLVYSCYLQKVADLLDRFYTPIQIGLAVLCGGLLLFGRSNSMLSIIRLNVLSVLFAVWVVQLLMLKDHWEGTPHFIGKISYELYLVQGLPLCFFSKQAYAARTFVPIDSPVYVLFLTFFFSIILSCILHGVNKKIQGRIVPILNHIL